MSLDVTYTELHRAVFRCRVTDVEELFRRFQADMIIDVRNRHNVTALMLASSQGNIEIVNILLAHGPKLELRDLDGSTALMCAVDKGHLEITCILLDNKANVNQQNFDGISPLMLACKNGHQAMVKFLISRPEIKLNLQSTDGLSALMFAALKGHHDIFTFMMDYVVKAEEEGLDEVADIYLCSPNGFTVLTLAIRNGYLHIVKHLLNPPTGNKKKIDLARLCMTQSPVTYALENGHVDIAKLLVENNVGLDIVYPARAGASNGEYTPLSAAITLGHFEVAKMLIDRKASLEALAEDNCSPLMLAICHKMLDIVKLLLDNKVELEIKNNSLNETALILSAKKGYFDIVIMLVRSGALLDKQDINGETALIKAVVNDSMAYGGRIDNKANVNQLNMVKFLLENGADPDLFSPRPHYTRLGGKDGQQYSFKNHEHRCSALNIAARERGNEEIVKLLLEHKASIDLKDELGGTALMVAAVYGNLEIFNLLLEANADVNLVSDEGNSALFHAQFALFSFDNAKEKNAEYSRIIRALVQHGADLNLKCLGGNTALTFMVKFRPTATSYIQYLLAHGAAYDVRNEAGHTALMIASESGNSKVIELIMREQKWRRRLPWLMFWSALDKYVDATVANSEPLTLQEKVLSYDWVRRKISSFL